MIPQEGTATQGSVHWLHRWLVCAILAGCLGTSILAMVLTQRPLFANMSATILLAMRPLIRWLYQECGTGGSQE